MPVFLARWLATAVVGIVMLVYYSSNKLASLKDLQSSLVRHLPDAASLRLITPRPHVTDDVANFDHAPSPLNTSRNHTRALVVARTAEEDASWVHTRLNDDDSNLERIVYTVDDPHSLWPVPLNKGHEVMPYLTYIIDRYASLPDVSIFMHAHQYTWHNNDILDSNSALTVQHLSSEKVIRDGYFNLRCHRDPGCPAHLHPLSAAGGEQDVEKPEEVVVAQAWREIFGPGDPVPAVLGQPCCSQFALSRERILSVPRERYLHFRQWLVDTPLEDAVAGRVWEYAWQYLWLGVHERCPEESACYCDGYGVCFGEAGGYEEWVDMRKAWVGMQPELDRLAEQDRDAPQAEWMESAYALELKETVQSLRTGMERLKNEALKRGKDPRLRAEGAGRSWKEGDGY